MKITTHRMALTVAKTFRLGTLAALALTAQAAWAGPFNININFTGGLTTGQQAVFEEAASTWESLLPEYQPGITLGGLTINASGVAIDGEGGVLGQAGPSLAGIRRQAGYYLASRGSMQFDIADIQAMESEGSFLSVVMHEMAHVMGFGTLWSLNGVYKMGSGRYTGANAVAAARVEVNRPGLSFIPVELSGGRGTANGHWDERDGGVCCTGYTDSLGRDATNELMTGWLNAPTFISQTTIQSFVDIGYVAASAIGAVSLTTFAGGRGELTVGVETALAVPEPKTYATLLAGLGLLGFMAWRRKQSAA